MDAGTPILTLALFAAVASMVSAAVWAGENWGAGGVAIVLGAIALLLAAVGGALAKKGWR